MPAGKHLTALGYIPNQMQRVVEQRRPWASKKKLLSALGNIQQVLAMTLMTAPGNNHHRTQRDLVGLPRLDPEE